MHDLLRRVSPSCVRGALLAGLLPSALPCQAVREPLRGTVVDPAGAPVVGAFVEVWRRAGEGSSMLDLTYSHGETLLQRVPTDRRGSFAVQLPAGLPCELRIDQPPHARWYRPQALPGEELRVALQPAATFTGRVVVSGSGAGAPSSLRAFQADGLRLSLGRTDAEGRFRFERLPAGAFTVEVAPDAAAAPGWQKLEFAAGQVLEHVFEASAGVVLTGRVTDAATGAPIEGAKVGEGWTLFRAVRTDRDGRYRLAGYGSSGHNEIFCEAPGHSRGHVIRPKELADPWILDFALQRGQGATGTLVDAEGKPLVGLYVGLFGTVHDGQNQFHDWVSCRTDAAGRFALRGLRDDLAGTLVVRGEGWASLVYHLPSAGAGGVMDAGTITVPRARILRGRVLGDDGKPVARIKVGLWGTNGDCARLAPMPKGDGLNGWELVRRYVSMRSVLTDDHGAFAFGDVAPGTCSLVVYSTSNERLERQEGIVVSADADPKPIEWKVSRDVGPVRARR